MSILGIVMVSGMDASAAILMLEESARLRGDGMPRDEAVIAAAPARLRPILMTNTIKILTRIPVAFLPGPGIDAYSPLTTVVIRGLLYGTVLNLALNPVMHTLVDDANHWFSNFKKRSINQPDTAE